MYQINECHKKIISYEHKNGSDPYMKSISYEKYFKHEISHISYETRQVYAKKK